MKILITGAAGFIGSNFTHFIVEKYPSYKVIALDNLSPYSNMENISSLEKDNKIIFEKADIIDFEKISEIYKKYEIDNVVNFAAESHNDRAIIDPSIFAKVNALGAQQLLEASRQFNVKRHIHISTIEVYGEQGKDTPYFTENSPLNAKTPYSAAKAAGDLLVRAYMQTYEDMDICITHCANNYGPYQFPEKLIPLAVSNLIQGKKVALYGDGKQRRDWLHVYDHCLAIDLILQMKERPSFGKDAATQASKLPIYDISARNEVTNIDIVKIILEEMNLDFDKWVEFVADRPNHDRRYLINPEKIETQLNFKPTINFDKGIRETVRWYMDNEKWWRDILKRSNNLQIDWSKSK
ncbi:dTDP-glucose 4,6-dehydratase [Candidatus Falkowbacteria bacterium]|jgi:dTDP-glucose 4,6-dehydratase|nr:dTDP-glucose 4,6-dehydratase [Candidatus Falkowbacteria bacterium]MBT4433236.1 dTDP-glucose 4,6-dehydratase [Candidatus Falkowbacteria bacterium]